MNNFTPAIIVMGCQVGQIRCWGNNYGISPQNKLFFTKVDNLNKNIFFWNQFCLSVMITPDK